MYTNKVFYSYMIHFSFLKKCVGYVISKSRYHKKLDFLKIIDKFVISSNI